MDNTYGFEIEFGFETKEQLARYLNNRKNLLNDNIGCDGAGVFTGEFRSSVLERKYQLVSHVNGVLGLLEVYNNKVSPICVNDLSGKPALYPLGFHLSIGKFDIGIFWRALKRYLYYRFIWNDSLYKIRCKLYPEMFRKHEDRIEFRFIPNYPEIILKEVQYILGDKK